MLLTGSRTCGASDWQLEVDGFIMLGVATLSLAYTGWLCPRGYAGYTAALATLAALAWRLVRVLYVGSPISMIAVGVER